MACHGPRKAEGGYRVDSYDALMTAGESGESPISSTDPQASELLRRLITSDISERMPFEGKPFPESAVDVFKAWITLGAAFDGENTKDPLWLVIPAIPNEDTANILSLAVPTAALTFSTNGERIFAGAYHALTERSVTDGSVQRRILNMPERILAMAISFDGKILAVGGGSPGKRGDVRMVDLSSGELLKIVSRSPDVILDVAFRPGHPQLAVARADATIQIIDTGTFEVLKTLSSHSDWVTSLAWSDDGTKLASTSRDKSAKVFDGATWELLASFREHEGPVQGIVFLPDGEQLVSVGSDRMLYRWEASGGNSRAQVELSGEPSKVVRTEKGILIPCSNNETLLFDTESNAISAHLAGHHDWVLSAAYHASTGRIATGSFDSEVRLWNALDQTMIEAWPPPTDQK